MDVVLYYYDAYTRSSHDTMDTGVAVNYAENIVPPLRPLYIMQ